MISIEGNKSALYQWDLNQRLVITDIAEDVEVHYTDAYNKNGECLVLLTYKENGQMYANIPNVLLQQKGIIAVYIYVEGENKAYTTQYAEILVLPREKPVDYVYTETEVLNYSTLEKRIRKIEEEGISKEQLEKSIESYFEENPFDGVSHEELNNAVEDALNQAKESGDFDGPPGPKGDKGDTPQKGVDYFTEVDKTEIVEDVSEEMDSRGYVKADFTDGEESDIPSTVNADTLGGYTREDIISETMEEVSEKGYVSAKLSGGEEPGLPATINADTLNGFTADEIVAEAVSSVPAASVENVVLYTEQSLTEAEKAQVRKNIAAPFDYIDVLNDKIEFLITDNITIQVLNFVRWGKLCQFTVQFLANENITSDYGFAVVRLPCSSRGRTWINNGSQFWIDANNKDIRVNGTTLAKGNYMWTGFYLTEDAR